MARRQSFPAAGRLSSGLLLRDIPFTAAENLSPRRILFFTDLHLRFQTLRNLCGGSSLKEWTATEKIGTALIRSVEETAPDILIFGGDLVSHTALYPEAFRILSALKAPVKLAVFGNWELKQRKWLPMSRIEREFQTAGFQILSNRSVTIRGIQFAGTEDFRFGNPLIPPPDPAAGFRFLISHNPDVLGTAPLPELTGYHIALCGHTHGGQIRLPLFGAVKTSSVFWKKYEYGIYTEKGKPKIIVSSGIGGTYIMKRFRCPPEMILLTLQPEKK